MVPNEANQSSHALVRVDSGRVNGKAPWHSLHVLASSCFTCLVGWLEWVGDDGPISLSVTLRLNCAHLVTEYLEHFSREVSRHLDLSQPGLSILWVEGKVLDWYVV